MMFTTPRSRRKAGSFVEQQLIQQEQQHDMEEGRCSSPLSEVSLPPSSSLSTRSSSLSSIEGHRSPSSSSLEIPSCSASLWKDTTNPPSPFSSPLAPTKRKPWRKMDSLSEKKDIEQYMALRHMTPLQERVNGLTMIPTAVYCLYVLLSGSWLHSTVIDPKREELMSIYGESLHIQPEDQADGCFHFRWFPNLHAMPPLPVLAVTIGILLHAPFSFIYHFFYAHTLSGKTKFQHWSRRMDQGMIHIASALVSYATSGRFDFFCVNVLYNLDCFIRQLFQQQVQPKQNQIRIVISILAYIIPFVKRGDFETFGQLCCVFGVSFWFFAKYPIGGWSHSMFHIIIALAPPLIVGAALELPASQPQLQVAARCAVWAE